MILPGDIKERPLNREGKVGATSIMESTSSGWTQITFPSLFAQLRSSKFIHSSNKPFNADSQAGPSVVSDEDLKRVPTCLKLELEPRELLSQITTMVFVGYCDDHMRESVRCLLKSLHKCAAWHLA